MDAILSKLIGALIGLARATDGNEHLITARSTSLLRECLSSRPSDFVQLQILLDKVDAVKQEMVPDCFFCANPCGRTSPYNLSSLQKEPPSIQTVKQQIIHMLLSADANTKDAALYRGLIAIGMENQSIEFLSSILQELE